MRKKGSFHEYCNVQDNCINISEECNRHMACILLFARNYTINRATFVCLSVCSLSPPRSFDGSSPNLVGVCRWTSELPLRGSFSKRSTGQQVTFSDTILYMIADDTRLTPHHCKKHTASFARLTGIFPTIMNV